MNAPLIPVFPLPVAVTVNDPVLAIATKWLSSTPPVKSTVLPLPWASIPVEVMLTVPVNVVTVSSELFLAVILMAKLAPAVWFPIAPPLLASIRKWSRASTTLMATVS